MFFDEFTKSQLTSWPLARNNYERLRNVIYRTIDFEGFQIRIQHTSNRSGQEPVFCVKETFRRNKLVSIITPRWIYE